MTRRPTRSPVALLAGLVWVGVGTMLLVRGVLMLRAGLEQAGTLGVVLGAGLGIALGAAKGRFVLSKAAARNRRRIAALEKPAPWQAFAPRFYPLIGLMIGLGVLLRKGAAVGLYGWTPVGSLYVGIGAALVVSAAVYLSPEPPPVDTTPADEPPARGPVAVLLVNLGTPSAATADAVRRYLREFLLDRRVVRLPRAVWRPILELFVLPRRAPRVAEAYASIWTPEGSPLLAHGLHLARALEARLPEHRVALAMRYGEPSLPATLDALLAEHPRELVVLPLFPQWSDTTNGTVLARVTELLTARRDVPGLRVIGSHHDDPGYLAAVAGRARTTFAERPVEHVLFSFHGLPEQYVRDGDPYACHCATSATLLARELGLAREGWTLAYQSRFGRDPWLAPATDATLQDLATRHRRVGVVLPGFAADCLETLEEIGQGLAEAFRAAGGEELVVVPCLNDDPAWVEAVARLVEG